MTGLSCRHLARDGSSARLGRTARDPRSRDCARSNASSWRGTVQSQESRHLETIPGVGIITATALAASVPESLRLHDPVVSSRPGLGLVPRQNSSGGKERLGRVSKMGNGYLRRLLVVGATSVTRRASRRPTRGPGPGSDHSSNANRTRLVTVAIANKTARVPPGHYCAKGETYRAAPANLTEGETRRRPTCAAVTRCKGRRE